MPNPNRVSGYCPHYDDRSGCCYLSGSMPDSGHRDYNCKSEQNCKTCGNYEAWMSGRNYVGK
ncbi:hypothetical protein AGMMS50268_39730 [Spirochaetia bacterium]|nr:hypothetical protein AGMMS50268_39730 [Spirochaetia bacterium]